MKNNLEQQNKIVLFQSRKIRRAWYKEQWYFSVVDIVYALTDSVNPTDYWYRVKKRMSDHEKSELSTICRQLKLESADGKKYKTDCTNTKGALRIIQSIPSPKAEPFKQWLAQIGKERLDEIENPELAQERMKFLYEKKGYPKDWIEKRLRGIAIRQNLTDEWKERGVKHAKDYAILTAEISKATFGITPSDYKKLKNLPEKSKINLRDHMTDLELIFTMLGEKVTTKISEREKPKAMPEHKKIARRGGGVAGIAREKAEKELGRSVISDKNYLSDNDRTKKLKNANP
ncbi:MAG TPA: phage antirepressor protein [Candidatus Moranbacteria bacterium]|nr:phage antirepressor protein [Candidatus Moranbacteria bacterium]